MGAFRSALFYLMKKYFHSETLDFIGLYKIIEKKIKKKFTKVIYI